MEKLTLDQGRRYAENWTDDHLRAALAEQPEEERRRLLETLYVRQKGSLEYLSLIQLEMGRPAPDAEDEQPGRLLSLLMHPAADLLMPVATLALVLLDQELAAVIAAILMTLRGLLRLSHPAFRRKETPVLPEVHEPYLLENELTRFLQKQEDRIRIDAAGIADRQAVTLVRERHDVGEDAVELYCALYEAALDTGDQEALAYPTSIAKMSLIERGLEVVPYGPETAALFDVMPGDGPAQMRWPAIRERETGAIVKRGLYLRQP